MANDMSDDREVRQIPGLATLIVPEELAQQVVDYVATLNASDIDVGGYMINLGQRFGRLAETTQTVTNCKDTGGGKDTLCDNDTYIVK